MNYNFTEITFPSADGKHTVYAEIYTPKTASARAVIQLSHGMVDYVGRYRELADYLTSLGFVFAGNHHLGHGRTAADPDELGFFADEGGKDFVIEDMHTMNKHLRCEFPTLPLIIFGHSMGSFLTRLYVEKYPNTVRGAVIHGTAGPNGALGMGKMLAKLIRVFRGADYRPRILTSLTIGAYSKKFGKDEGRNAWLTRDASQVADRDDDPFSNFTFTVAAYQDLFSMLSECNKKQWFKNYPKHLPTLVISGDKDPVGNFGKGPDYVYKNLLINGCESVSLKMYEGARHELFKETNREEVFSDIGKWLSDVAEKAKLTF